MTSLAGDQVWRQRVESIDKEFDQLKLPEVVAARDELDQDEEWCEVQIGDQHKRLLFHDYSDIYAIPGLYEELFYENLKCCSPSCVTRLLGEVANDFGDEAADFRVLDLGAGNGMVGDELSNLGVETLIGADIIDAAKEATYRDRPDIYDEYYIADFTDLPEVKEESIRQQKPNCLTSVAALGYGDIPPLAFLKALDLIENPGWIAFTIKENFLREDDSSGFNSMILQLKKDELIQIQCYRRYQHRISLAGDPLYYVAVIAKKLRQLPAELFAEWQTDN